MTGTCKSLIVGFLSVCLFAACGGENNPATVMEERRMPPPLSPSGISSTPGDGCGTIDWHPVGGATSYNIYWSTKPGVTKSNGNKVEGVNKPFVHKGRKNGTTYYYVVTAVNSGGESEESKEVPLFPSADRYLPPH